MTGLCTLLMFLAVWPIDPGSSVWDNENYYMPSQRLVVRDGVTLADLVVTPFYRVKSAPARVLASEAKPVYIAALRLWGLLYHKLRPAEEIPNPFEYLLFVALTTWWLGYMTWLVGERLGQPAAGFAAALLVICNPWQANFLYMPFYPQFSAALLLCAFLQTLEATPRAVFFAGILSSAAVLSNNAILAFLPGLALVAAFLNLPDWKKSLGRVAVYIAGILSVFAFFGAIAYTDKIRVLCGEEVYSPWTVLRKYLDYTMHRHHFDYWETWRKLDQYPHQIGLFLEILRETSLLWLVAFSLLPVAAGWVAWRSGWREFLRKTWQRDLAVLLLASIPVVAALELGLGVQLGRSYFPAVPFLVLAVMVLLRQAWLRLPLRVAIPALALLTSVYAAEVGFRLVEQERCWHGAQAECLARLKAGDRVLFLAGDGAATELMGNVTLAALDESSDAPACETVDAQDVERIAEWSRAGRVLLITGAPLSEDVEQTLPLPTDSQRLMLQLESGRIDSGSGPIAARLIDRWPHGAHPHALYRYEDEFLWWRYSQGLVDEDQLKAHVWELSAGHPTQSGR
ncbi:MAG: hypothetical protein WED34_16595 [Planctomycetales bacterium]